MITIFFLSLVALLIGALGCTVYWRSWDSDGRLTSRGGLQDIDRFHLISRWGAHH